jgi:lipopolysaccharide/colanic/teichoic acid biosynthesis glycosyltransferase
MGESTRVVKRAFDVTAAVVGLAILWPLMIIVAMAVWVDSRGEVVFVQERVGRHFRRFRLYKFRTMVCAPTVHAPAITRAGDPRVTRVGRFLRGTKLDEIPQLVNVLKGDMSLVGPRPEVPAYVELFERDYREILTVRPGITDLASIKYRHESKLLAAAVDPQREYITRILPDKIDLAKQYVRRASLAFDIRLITQTLFALCVRGER